MWAAAAAIEGTLPVRDQDRPSVRGWASPALSHRSPSGLTRDQDRPSVRGWASPALSHRSPSGLTRDQDRPSVRGWASPALSHRSPSGLTRPQRILNPAMKRLKRTDRRILRFLRTRGHSAQAESAMKGLGMAGEWGAVWVAIGLVGALADGKRRMRWLRTAPVAPAAVGLNYLVKLGVRRDRPRLRRLPPLAGAPSALSFPSAHATASLAAATARGRVRPRARLPLYALAAAICVTRPYLGMHYPSDVLAGAALGVGIGAAWPGLRGRGTEDRLIDLVVSSARKVAADDSGPNGDRPESAVHEGQQQRRPDPQAP